MIARDIGTATNILAAASAVVDGIQAGMNARGFPDVRPAHGFAFARIAAGDATALDVAGHLGVSKQAGSQLVEQLVTAGYLTRTTDPTDARRRVLALTARGRACTRAAEEAAVDAVAPWRKALGAGGMRALDAALAAVPLPGPVRPAW